MFCSVVVKTFLKIELEAKTETLEQGLETETLAL